MRVGSERFGTGWRAESEGETKPEITLYILSQFTN